MVIKEDKENNIVFINGKPISGFIDEDVCPMCKLNRIYGQDYDAYFCVHCNEWLESKCGDSNCEYFTKRPVKPLMLTSI